MMWARIMGVRNHPMVTINNHTYKGEFSGKDITQAICISFKDRPSVCSKKYID